MKEWVDLLTKPSWVAFAALAILGALYLVRLALDFLKSTVLPGVYERRLQKRRIVLPLAEKVLDPATDTAIYFRDGDPKSVDFRNGCIAILSKSKFPEFVVDILRSGDLRYPLQ